MRVALISGTGIASLDGGYICWAPESGAFSVEHTGQPLSQEQVRALLEKGYAIPLAQGAAEAASATPDAAEEEILRAAAAAGERHFEDRRRRERREESRRRLEAFRPYARLAWIALAIIMAFLAWRLYLASPDAWRSGIEESIRGVLRHYVL